MKMLANLGEKLGKAEQRTIIGGQAPAGRVQTTCSCTGSVGSWVYSSTSPIPVSVLTNDIQTYCASRQGHCSAIEINEA